MFDLTGTIAIANSEAVVRYQGVNRTSEVIFVAHLAIDAAFKMYPNAAYTALSQDGQRLNLILGKSPLPYDREVEFGVSSLLVEAAPGAQVTGEIRLPMPIDEWDGYNLLNRNVDVQIVAVKQIHLAVDIIPKSQTTRTRAAKEPPEHWLVGGSFVVASLLLTSNTPLQVRKRSDAFPRT